MASQTYNKNDLWKRINKVAEVEYDNLNKAFKNAVTIIHKKYQLANVDEYAKAFPDLKNMEKVKEAYDSKLLELKELAVDLSKYLQLVHGELINCDELKEDFTEISLEGYMYTPAWLDFKGTKTLEDKINEILDDEKKGTTKPIKDWFEGADTNYEVNKVIQKLTAEQHKRLFKELPVDLINENSFDYLASYEIFGPDRKEDSERLIKVIDAVIASNPNRKEVLTKFKENIPEIEPRYINIFYDDDRNESEYPFNWADCRFGIERNKPNEISDEMYSIPF